MATVPVQLDEESLIRERIVQIELPDGVRFKSLEPMTEWTGEPAWRITFSASTKIPLTKKRLADFRRISREVEDSVFSLHFDKYPFVQFVDGR